MLVKCADIRTISTAVGAGSPLKHTQPIRDSWTFGIKRVVDQMRCTAPICPMSSQPNKFPTHLVKCGHPHWL